MWRRIASFQHLDNSHAFLHDKRYAFIHEVGDCHILFHRHGDKHTEWHAHSDPEINSVWNFFSFFIGHAFFHRHGHGNAFLLYLGLELAHSIRDGLLFAVSHSLINYREHLLRNSNANSLSERDWHQLAN